MLLSVCGVVCGLQALPVEPERRFCFFSGLLPFQLTCIQELLMGAGGLGRECWKC